MAKYPATNVPLVEARRKGGKQKPTLIVLHSTGTTSVKGAALGVAMRWHKPDSPLTSCHYVVDEATEYQCVPDNIVAFHCGYNFRSIGIEMCDDPSEPVTRWHDKPHKAVLIRTSDLVATLCLNRKIPARYLTDAELMRWGKRKSLANGGIVTHHQMTRVFHRSTHWDPGAWPSKQFLRMVKHDMLAKPPRPRRFL